MTGEASKAQDIFQDTVREAAFLAASGDPPAARRSPQEMQLLAKCPEKYPALSTPHRSSGNKSDTIAVDFAQPP